MVNSSLESIWPAHYRKPNDKTNDCHNDINVQWKQKAFAGPHQQ